MHSHHLIGEFIGTYLLAFIFFVTGSPLAFGLGIAVLAQFASPVSNSSFNPYLYAGEYAQGKRGGEEIVWRIIVGLVASVLAWYTVHNLKKSHVKFPSKFA